MFYYGLDAWKGFFIYRVLISSRERFWRIYLNPDERYPVDSANITWGFCSYKEWKLVQQEQIISILRTNHGAGRDRASPNPPLGSFDYGHILESSSLSGGEFPHATFLRNLNPINEEGWRNQGKKGVYLSRGLDKRGQAQRQGSVEAWWRAPTS